MNITFNLTQQPIPACVDLTVNHAGINITALSFLAISIILLMQDHKNKKLVAISILLMGVSFLLFSYNLARNYMF